MSKLSHKKNNQHPLYEGKCKALFASEKTGLLRQVFHDDTTAFDGKKHEIINNKGRLNCAISSFIFENLHEADIPTHFVERIANNEMLVHELDMLPIEVVVRNIAAGSICKRLGLRQGMNMPRPLVELFYKSDALGDPMICDEHALLFYWATAAELTIMRTLALDINTAMMQMFAAVGITLVDFKLEFGRKGTQIMLGDEISPDACRLWDSKTGQKLDKDVFRQDLGTISDAYSEVAKRLNIVI
ncbi:MAG: phosphoribosylaminoimidazolesuccinocarboxamide synthase [Mariprofundales bacterium]